MSSCISKTFDAHRPASSNGECATEEKTQFGLSIPPPDRQPDFSEFVFNGWVVPEQEYIIAQHKEDPTIIARIPFSDRKGIDPRQRNFERFHAFMDIVRAYERGACTTIPPTNIIPPFGSQTHAKLSQLIQRGNSPGS